MVGQNITINTESSTDNRYYKSKDALSLSVQYYHEVTTVLKSSRSLGKSSLFPTLYKKNADIQDSPGELILSFCHIVPRDPAQVTRLSGRVLRLIKNKQTKHKKLHKNALDCQN